MPLVVSHLGEEADEDNFAITTDLFSASEVSRRNRWVLFEEVDEEEEEEESLVPPFERQLGGAGGIPTGGLASLVRLDY